jgi:hypothetical protein
VTSLQASVALALIAVAAIVAGVVLLAGVAWGLIVVGVFALVAAVLLYDPAPRNAPDAARAAQVERGKAR